MLKYTISIHSQCFRIVTLSMLNHIRVINNQMTGESAYDSALGDAFHPAHQNHEHNEET